MHKYSLILNFYFTHHLLQLANPIYGTFVLNVLIYDLQKCFLNSWDTTHFWVAGTHFWVAGTPFWVAKSVF